MSRSFCLLIISLVACLPLVAQEQPKSRLAKEALALHEKHLEEARLTYDAYRAEAFKILIGFLTDARAEALKANDLDEAQAIIAKIKEAEMELALLKGELPTKVGEIRRFQGHKGYVGSICFTPDNRTIVSSAQDGTIRLWSVLYGKELGQIGDKGHDLRYTVVSKDGRRLFCGAPFGLVHLWDLQERKIVRKVGATHDFVRSAAISPDGRRGLTGSGLQKGGALQLWDVETGKEIMKLGNQPRPILSVAFSPDGKRALSANDSSQVVLWDMTSGKELRRFSGHHVAFFPDGKHALSTSYKGGLSWWDLTTGNETRKIADVGGGALAISPDGKRILVPSRGRIAVSLLDAATGKEVQEFQGHEDKVTALAFSPDGQLAVSGSGDGDVRLWRLPK